MCLKLITNDLFDIADRLKSVKNSYDLYYNEEKERFEVHDSDKRSLAFVVPYDELDARTVEYALYSRVENAKQIFEQIQAHNNRIEKEQKHDAIERAAVAIQERRLNEG